MEDLAVSPWASRRVLVTGATGLVGSWLCNRLLAEGAHVCALVADLDPRSLLVGSGAIDHCRVVQGLLEDTEAVERAISEPRVDTIFHLGAQALVGVAYEDPTATLRTNVVGTWNVLDGARRHDDHVERVVVASSDKAYGAATLPTPESAPLAGRAPYDVSKSCADLLAQSYRASFGVPVVVGRCGNIYGAGDLHWSRLVPGAIRALLHGESLVVRSDGTYRRDYVYVEDIVDGYLLLAEATRGDAAAYNLSDGPSRSVLEIYDAVASTIGRRLAPIIANDARGELAHQHLDDSLARSVLGWTPRVGFEEGLTRTVAWYRELFAVD